MAANAQQIRIWKCVAVFLAVAVACASALTPGRISLFTFTSPVSGVTVAEVDVGTSVTIQCRVDYNASNRAPIIRLKKTFGNSSWPVSDNDDLDAAFSATNRFVPKIVDGLPNGNDIYAWTINNLNVGDTGNYTCYTGSVNVSSLSISLNVTAAPTQLSLYINGELQPQSMPSAIIKKTLNVGQAYNIMCVATGGNPFPNVTLTSGMMVVPPSTTNMITARANNVDAVAAVNRTTAITAIWTMTTANLGTPVTCNAGLKTMVAISNSFIPIADNALPNFQCPDQFPYDGKATVLTLTCKVFATNMSSYYVTWQNSTTNQTVQGTLGVDIQSTKDSRYSLRVNAPQSGDIWWTMTLTINNADKITDLSKITFHYVAISSRGQALHDVTVKSTGMSPGTSGGSLTVSRVGCLAVLISVAMATLFGRP